MYNIVLVLIAQSCPTLCNPMDYSLPGPVRGILQAKILEWVAISSSNIQQGGHIIMKLKKWLEDNTQLAGFGVEETW